MQDFLHPSGRIALATLLLCLCVPGSAQSTDLRSLIAAGRLDEMRWPNFAADRPLLQDLYRPVNFEPLWLNGPQPKLIALAMIAAFQRAAEEGLDPEDYDASRWKARLDTLTGSSAAQARFDLAMSLSSMRFSTALYRGRINPQSVHGAAFDAKPFDPAAFLRSQLLASTDLRATLASIEPPFATYRRTRQALVRYLKLARLDSGEKLLFPRKTIDPGQTYAGMPRLIQLLHLLGDLPPEISPSPDTQIYDATTAGAVKRFQRRHDLEDDGRLGVATIRQLNVPLQQRVQQLRLSLERLRWLPAGISGPAIFVNIPDFRLRAVDGNQIALEMRVVVGRAMRTQTPIFSANMTHVIFRPYWNVPRSILRNEILPATRRDRAYLNSKGFEVITLNGEIVSTGLASDDVLAQLQQRQLAIRQRPGSDNSLGLVKLMFPNENSVYLHDTPARSLFARSRRDFSHGCIRVENPAELTAWALHGNPGWTIDKVQQAMRSGKNNVLVNLAKPVPVFIVYGTALAYENGEVHFSDDIYGFDASLAAALARGDPYR